MMYREQIDEQIERLRGFTRILYRRYSIMQTEETYEELMCYNEKINSWKRIRKNAPRMLTVNQIGQIVPMNPRKKHGSLAELLADAMIAEE